MNVTSFDRFTRLPTAAALVVGVIGLAVALWAIVPATAQDNAAAAAPGAATTDVAAGAAAWRLGGCQSCHGQFAEGGEGGEQPAGPNLHRTRLDRQSLIETIGCGLPETQMPSHLKGAYTEVDCYGFPLGRAPDRTDVRNLLTADEVAALADFLLAEVVGKNTITKEMCGLFYGDPNHRACANLQ